MGFTMINYVILEDGDTLNQPNAFGIKKDFFSITLKDIYRHFPIVGQYLFRFKCMTEDGIKIWLDFKHLNHPVPTYKKRIIMKVERVS